MDKDGLTKRQLEIMKYFWNSDTSLLVSDIVRQSGLNIGTVQSAVRAMVGKNVIAEDTIIHSGKVLARTYKPIITNIEYMQQQYMYTPSTLEIMGPLIDQVEDIAVIEELEKILADRVAELKEEQENEMKNKEEE